MIDETVNNEPERVGFCQDCGRPLTRETVRTVGSGVFCEPCLETRLGTAPPPYGAGAVPNAGVPVGGAVPPFREPFPPIGGDNPSPGLAALLGLIPGVGAMYNGQFAKGIAHIVIFALLSSLSHASGFFGLLVFGWVIYQSFEAYHTAKARREGLPLPDPFGLNNIGTHVGMHFRGNAPGVPPTQSGPGWTGYTPPQTVVTPPPPPPPEPGQAWAGVPVPPANAPYTQTAAPVWDTPAWTPPPPAAPVAGQEWTSAPVAYDVPAVPLAPARINRFPGAAVWLIGFGLIFLVLNIVPELRFSIHKVFPFLVMAFGVGVFLRRMTFTGGLAPAEGEGEAYAARAIGSLRWPMILFTVGVLWMLQAFDVFWFGQTWPVLVIVFGVLLLLERSLGNRFVPVAPVVGVAVSPDANAVSGDGKGA